MRDDVILGNPSVYLGLKRVHHLRLLVAYQGRKGNGDNVYLGSKVLEVHEFLNIKMDYNITSNYQL